MKKRIIVWYSSFFLILILLPNIFYIVANVFFEKNFIFSHTIHTTLEKFFGENNDLLFKKGDFYYKMGMYNQALEKYQLVQCKTDILCQKLYHNIGNVYFRIGESKQINEKIPFLQKSLEYYKKSLNVFFHPETKKNYEYVLKILEMLYKKQEEKRETSTGAEEGTKEEKRETSTGAEEGTKEEKRETSTGAEEGIKEEKSETSTGAEEGIKEEKRETSTGAEEGTKEEKSETSTGAEEGIKDIKTQSGSLSHEEKTFSGAQDNITPKGPTIEITSQDLELFQKSLTSEEKKQIEDYINQLKNEEKENMYLNKPKSDRNIFDILIQDFSDISEINQDW